MLRLLRMIGLGFLLAAGVTALVGPPGAGWWGLPIGLILVSLTSVLLSVARTTGGLAAAPPELVQAALAAGRTGTARIDALRQTGTRINDQPVCILDLTVQPRHGAAFRTRLQDVVPLTDMPAHQPGIRRPVALLLEGEADLQFVDGQVPPASVQDVPPASEAIPLRLPQPGPLRADGTRMRPLISTSRRGRPLRALAFTLVMLLTAGLLLLPQRAAVEQTLAALPEGRLHLDLRSPDGIAAALGAVQEGAGHDRVMGVVIMEDLVVVDAPVAAGEVNTDEWTYRRGHLERTGPTLIQPDVAQEQFAVDDVAWETLWPAAEQAAAEQGLEGPGDVSFSVSRDLAEDGGWTGPVLVRFSVGDEYTETFYVMEADGTGLHAT